MICAFGKRHDQRLLISLSIADFDLEGSVMKASCQAVISKDLSVKVLIRLGNDCIIIC